eukprot:7108354-Prymnesium_polylepis.1
MLTPHAAIPRVATSTSPGRHVAVSPSLSQLGPCHAADFPYGDRTRATLPDCYLLTAVLRARHTRTTYTRVLLRPRGHPDRMSKDETCNIVHAVMCMCMACT